MSQKHSGKGAHPFHPPAYQGDEDKDRLPHEGPPVKTRSEGSDRGRKAPREGSGVVAGSGAEAGGTGRSAGGENYSGDPVGGGGSGIMPRPRKPGSPGND